MEDEPMHVRVRNHLLVRTSFVTVVVAVFCFLLPPFSHSQTTETSRVLDGCGGWITNATRSSLVSGCQPTPVGFNSGISHMNHAGFLQTFLMHTNLDHDADGVPDENDLDDDNDNLTDAVELSGDSFNPQTSTDPTLSDTDGDRMSDFMEAETGTNPRDSESLLRVTEISEQEGEVAVSWQSRDGYSYDLMTAHSAEDIQSSATVVVSITASGGVSPWYDTLSTGIVTSTESRAFYRIAVTNDP